MSTPRDDTPIPTDGADDMTYDDTQILAKESEEALLYRDMKADAVQQMLRRLSVAHRPS